MVRLIKEVNHYHYGNSSESRRKEIADRFGKSFTPDDHNILCKDGKVLNIRIGKKYRCTACNGQRVEIVDIEETFEDGTAMLDVAYRNNRYTVASTQIYESIKRNKRVKEDFTITDADYGRDIAEEVANIMHDMDWQDSLDDSYDNPDEAWDAYVDQVLEQLESDPQEVIDWLEDEEGSGVHRSLIRNIIKCFGGNVSESVKKKNSKSLMESVSDKLELQEIANAINALNDDRSWVELDASVQKRENENARFKYVCRVMVTNRSYTNVTNEYRVVQAHRGGFVIHCDNPIGSEWITDAQKVIDYFEEMVASNIEEDF